MTIKKIVLISAVCALVALFLQNMVVFSSFFVTNNEKTILLKIVLEVFLFVAYFATVYVFLYSVTDYRKDRLKYVTSASKMAFFTYIFFLAVSSSIFSSQSMNLKIALLGVATISCIINALYSIKKDNERIKELMKEKDEK